MKVPFYKHNLNEQDLAGTLDALRGEFLTTGPTTRQFEQAFAKVLGSRGSVACSSWTTAAFLVLKAWGIGPGDEVILPPLTFISTANIIEHCGAKPVFVDVEPKTGLIDASLVESAITERTKAIIAVHLYGQMADMGKISEIAKRHGIKTLEDSAHCIDGSRDSNRPGGLSDAACFSFYATKNITCGEGGAVVSNDLDLLEKVRCLQMHGMSKSAIDRYYGTYRHWDMDMLGYKANLTNFQAAMLLSQLDRLGDLRKARESLCRFYEDRFLSSKIDYPVVLKGVQSDRHLFTVWAPDGFRDQALAALQSENIGVAVNFRAIHLLRYYVQKYHYRENSFPVAEAIGRRTLTLPMYPKLTAEQLAYVANTVVRIMDGFRPGGDFRD